MSQPSSKELQESIQELTAYKKRLTEEVLNIGQKLRMPKDKLDATIQEHPELTTINQALDKLKAQLGE